MRSSDSNSTMYQLRAARARQLAAATTNREARLKWLLVATRYQALAASAAPGTAAAEPATATDPGLTDKR